MIINLDALQAAISIVRAQKEYTKEHIRSVVQDIRAMEW